jgi:hypothetical protein
VTASTEPRQHGCNMAPDVLAEAKERTLRKIRHGLPHRVAAAQTWCGADQEDERLTVSSPEGDLPTSLYSRQLIYGKADARDGGERWA